MEAGPRRARSRAMPRPRGRAEARRPLVWAGALGTAWLLAASLRLPPAFVAGSGAGHIPRGPRAPPRCDVARAAAREADGASAWGGPPLRRVLRVPFRDLEVGQALEGTVVKEMGHGYAVDVLAEREGLVLNEEVSDGFPLHRLLRGDKVTCRVQKIDPSARKLWLTLRSGDLARPGRQTSRGDWKGIDLSPFTEVPGDQWLEGEVQGIVVGMAAWIIVKAPETGEVARGRLFKNEMTGEMMENFHLGMKVRVRVLGCEPERGRLDLTAKDP